MGTDSIIGLLALGTVGLFTIAAIYQLGKSSNPIVPTAGAVYDNTLTSIFK
jgi:hypothetical protein